MVVLFSGKATNGVIKKCVGGVHLLILPFYSKNFYLLNIFAEKLIGKIDKMGGLDKGSKSLDGGDWTAEWGVN